MTAAKPFRLSQENPSFDSFLNPKVISVSGPFSSSLPQNCTHARTRVHDSDFIDFTYQNIYDRIIDRIAALDFLQAECKTTTRTAISFIDSLSASTPSKESKPENPNSDPCPVCAEEFESSSLISKLPCKHVSQYECIVPWLYRSHVCPICRFKLPKETVAGPTMTYMVRIGNKEMEGWGRCKESCFWDAVLKNVPGWFSAQ